MTSFTLKRDGDRSLAFDGEQLGHASSRRGNQARWFEVGIYRTEGGAYIVAGVGKSTMPGEVDRHWAIECSDGYGVVAALTRTDEDDIEYLTRTAREALEAASAADRVIGDAFLKRVA